jgi:hypothetical protein
MSGLVRIELYVGKHARYGPPVCGTVTLVKFLFILALWIG